MNNGSYFERRFGGGPRGKSVELSPEAVYSPPTLDRPVDIDEIKTNAVSAMSAENGATSEEVAAQLDFIAKHPEFAQSIRQDFSKALNRAKKMNPDELAATLKNEVEILSKENPDPAAIEKMQKEGVLIPVVMTRKASEVLDADQEIKESAAKKTGKLKRNNKIPQRLALGGSAALITVASAYLDFTFSKEGLADVVDVVVDKLGLEQTTQIIGQKFSVGMNMVSGSPIAMSAIEQSAYGKGAITMAIVGGALSYLGYQKYHSENFVSLFDFKKHPIKSTATTALLAGFLGLGSGNVTQSLGEVLRSQQLATGIKDRFQPTKDKMTAAVKAAGGLEGQIKPIITNKVEIAFKTGQVKVGPLTASTWRALNGNVPYKDGKLIADAYEGKDTTKMPAIEKAVAAVNARPEYQKLGMKEADGAMQLLGYLTGPLPKTGQELTDHFDAMLAVAEDKASVTLMRAIFGKVNFLDSGFYKGKVSMNSLFSMQEQYPEKYTKLIQQVLALNTLNKYLGDVEAELRTSAKVEVRLKGEWQIPNLGYTEDEIGKLKIPRDDYNDVLNPSKIDKIVNLFWGTPAAWKARQDIVSRDLVENKMGADSNETSVLMQRLAYEGSIYGIFLLLVVGSVVGTGKMRKVLNRWNEADMDEYSEKLREKDDEIATAIVAYAHALSADVAGTLRTGGIQVQPSNVINRAFKKSVSAGVARAILDKTTDPRTGGKLSDAPDAQDFIERVPGRHFDGDDRKNVLRAYEAQQSAWLDELAKDPFAAIEGMMPYIDDQFRATAAALMAANATNPGTAERELAFKKLKDAYEKREQSLMSQEADAAARHVAQLTARRNAMEQMVKGGDRDNESVDIILNGTDAAPKLTSQEVIATYILSDIDTEIATWKKVIGELEARGATISPVPPEYAELSNAEWEQEREAFLAREMNMMTEGTEVTEGGQATLEKLNAYLDSINKGLLPIKSTLEENLRKYNPNATITFSYGYSPVRMGPTIQVLLADSSAPGLPMVKVPFLYKVPSEDARESQKVLSDIQTWASPDGILSQRLRVSTTFEKTRADYREQLVGLTSMGSNGQYDIDAVENNPARFDAYIQLADIMREQKANMEKLIQGGTLTVEEVSTFISPLTSIRDIWKSSITNTIQRAKQGRFKDIGDKKLILAFDSTDKGYLIAVSKDASLPVALESIPESDKLLIKRAAVA